MNPLREGDTKSDVDEEEAQKAKTGGGSRRSTAIPVGRSDVIFEEEAPEEEVPTAETISADLVRAFKSSEEDPQPAVLAADALRRAAGGGSEHPQANHRAAEGGGGCDAGGGNLGPAD